MDDISGNSDSTPPSVEVAALSSAVENVEIPLYRLK